MWLNVFSGFKFGNLFGHFDGEGAPLRSWRIPWVPYWGYRKILVRDRQKAGRLQVSWFGHFGPSWLLRGEGGGRGIFVVLYYNFTKNINQTNLSCWSFFGHIQVYEGPFSGCGNFSGILLVFCSKFYATIDKKFWFSHSVFVSLRKSSLEDFLDLRMKRENGYSVEKLKK